MIRKVNCYLLVLVCLLTSCSDLSSGDVESILTNAKAYPLTVEVSLYCNSDDAVKDVIEKNLVKEGLVTAQLKHTSEDLGQPLVRFTNQAQPYLLPTSDTLKSFDIQRIKAADEIFSHVRNIDINAAGTKAVVDYVTEITNRTPFIVLYKQEVDGEQKRRTFFTKENNVWKWDGKVIKMPR